MSKFKVGDKVRWVSDNGMDYIPEDNTHDAEVISHIGTEVKARFPNLTSVERDGAVFTYNEMHFRLREPKKLTIDAFNAGDRVRLIRNDGMAAPVGSMATVEANKREGIYLNVRWDQPNKQHNGGYKPDYFEVVTGEERHIVVRINKVGAYEIAPDPRIHFTVAAAEAEAKRLAALVPNKTFRVLTLGKAFSATTIVNITEIA